MFKVKLLRVEARHSVWSAFLFTTTRTAHTERTEDLTSHFQTFYLYREAHHLCASKSFCGKMSLDTVFEFTLICKPTSS